MELLGLQACLLSLQFDSLQVSFPLLPVLLARNPGSEGPLKHTRSQIQKCTMCDKDTNFIVTGMYLSVCVCLHVCG